MSSVAIANLLERIWAEILGVEKVDHNSNFLELGGDSVRAMHVVARIHTTIQVEVSVGDVLGVPTLAELAHRISEKQKPHRVAGHIRIQGLKR